MEQKRGAVKRGGERRGPIGEDIIRLANDVDILGGPEERRGLDCDGQCVTVGLGSRAVEVEEILVSGVVHGVKEAEDPARIVGGSGYEVG